MFEAYEDDMEKMRVFIHRQRVALANAWSLVEGDTVRADMECGRERLRALVRQLPDAQDFEPTGSDLEEHEHRLDLCGSWDLVPVERWRLDSFIYAMAAVEIERRLKAHGAKAERRARKTPHILPKSVPQGAASGAR